MPGTCVRTVLTTRTGLPDATVLTLKIFLTFLIGPYKILGPTRRSAARQLGTSRRSLTL